MERGEAGEVDRDGKEVQVVGGRKRRPAGPPPACTHPRAASRGTAEAHSALLLLVLASKSPEHEKPKAGSVLEKAESA